MKITVFRAVKSCSLVDSSEHFGKSPLSTSSVILKVYCTFYLEKWRNRIP